MTYSKEERKKRRQYFARQMQELPDPKPPHQMLQINAGAHIERVKRLVEVLSKDQHTPKDEHKRAIHVAAVRGLRQLLKERSHGMTVKQMEDFLHGEVPQFPDKPRVIRFAVYAIDRYLRKEQHLARFRETRLLAKQSLHPQH